MKQVREGWSEKSRKDAEGSKERRKGNGKGGEEREKGKVTKWYEVYTQLSPFSVVPYTWTFSKRKCFPTEGVQFNYVTYHKTREERNAGPRAGLVS